MIRGERSPGRATVLLLAGGEASRLPGKLMLPVDGEPMLVRVFKRLTSDGRPCVISTRAPLDSPLLPVLNAPVVIDEYHGSGPLGGLASAAPHVATPLLFAAAGDLPDLDGAFVAHLEAEYDRLSAAGEPPEAVVPVWADGRLEPLAALYATRPLADAARRTLAAGRRRVTAALDLLRVATVAVRPEDEARLANVNTPGDYRAYRA